MIMRIDVGDLNEIAAEMAVHELRRLKASFEAAGKLRVADGKLTAQEAAERIQPLQIALNIFQAVSLTFAEPIPEDTPSVERRESGVGSGVKCCLCESEGTEKSGLWLCPNKLCPRNGIPLSRFSFEGYPLTAQETRQDRAGSAAEKPIPSGVGSDASEI